VYALQPGRLSAEKDAFYEQLLSSIAAIDDTEYLIVAGNFNGHVGKRIEGFDNQHGGNGYGIRNSGHPHTLCAACDLSITNTFFVRGTVGL